ncbi:Putative exosome complex RNA-binding protein 1/RRP40/RRP4 [Septoria linicola]|uniref:Exosome complex RNA-binding protein 1/RRP40/RRP4 n=1 Tax=Septoria linicola TaxID=215465 RepID=A0A9Q9EI79_9PEZI|nr:putative exosome complex RNA-binding protein 1/RRP40/RRP4 [Septoria linicola]USW50804.1 Putative exosome complex RNA-binding protein 1/RRP40/RRP4 [Septoria linicola]
MASTVLLPGDAIPSELLPKSKKGTLTLGPHLRHLPPSTLLSTSSGTLQVDHKKSALWLEHPNGRYLPAVNDLVIAQIHHSSTDTYHCSLTPHTPYALLGQLAFEGASKKTRPQLKSGDLVYARVSKASKWEDTEIECVNSNTGKGEGMGPLTGGMMFNVSAGFARRLMLGAKKGGIVVLDVVGEKVKFEVAVGRNGRVWIDSGSVKETVAIGRLLVSADEQGWEEEKQRSEVKRILREIVG